MAHGKITKKMADVCKNACPVCKTARKKGEGLIHAFVKLEAPVCPFCRSYKKVYGVPSYEKIKK